jgi:hypothetical protein
MLNDFKHLDNNLTVVYAKRGQAEKVPFYINTDCFDILNNGTDGYWRAVNKDGKLRIFSYTEGKNVRAARLIAGIANDSSKYIFLANGNEFDLRRENIIVYSGGVAFRKSSLTKKAKEIANSLPSLPSDDNDKANSTGTEGSPKQTISLKRNVLFELEIEDEKHIFPVRDTEEEEKLIRMYNLLTSSIKP